ncbi:MAG: hypothetical protein UX79_C0006G0030 [candidate division WWE3 bacterium GW2011_GWB1_47_11]|uniref:Uncharacterized protein n=2 Tax=Katanobacteria TaxID=422282 RepID=A0A0G1RK71_UNCKA|nr:MAG: hypothetical protein UX69_C0001G0018 [candidate division WWE3 bacterium GW2011_GWA2_46_9]KKU57694.1 MAG: hypothetical protein UX79_C0006G0030 [candidate division WWE3 bacterium GW2011_GWB1_47_11]
MGLYPTRKTHKAYARHSRESGNLIRAPTDNVLIGSRIGCGMTEREVADETARVLFLEVFASSPSFESQRCQHLQRT